MKAKLLYLAQNRVEADLIKLQLNQLNIRSFCIGGELQIGIGELPVDVMYSKVYVNHDDYEIAKKFIDKYKSNISSKEYEAWICEFCESEVPNSFLTCWNCSNNRVLSN